MQRYSVITHKLPREIVLLKGLPCVWSKCTFCDYIDDNTSDEAHIQRVADEELAKVTGEFGRLEIINSGSIQELTPPVLEQVRALLHRARELFGQHPVPPPRNLHPTSDGSR